MARSRRKSPAGGITAARSDKAFKSLAARKLRAAERVALAAGADIPHRRAVDSPWNWPKDGKRWFGRDWANDAPKIIRK
jgi:hypothetical protein